MTTELTYSSAFAQLEELVRQIEDKNIQLDTLAEKVKQANELISFCELKLRGIALNIEEAAQGAAGSV